MTYRMEYQEIYKGYHLVVMFVHTHRCGYVGLPKGHKYIGKHYDEIDVDVHGGLTFAEKNVNFKLNDYDYYLGFDCSHFGDGYDIETMKKYGARKEQVELLSSFNYGEVRSKEYVLNELKELVEQL